MCDFCDGKEGKTTKPEKGTPYRKATYVRYPGKIGRCIQVIDKSTDQYFDVEIQYCPLCGKSLT